MIDQDIDNSTIFLKTEHLFFDEKNKKVYNAEFEFMGYGELKDKELIIKYESNKKVTHHE